MLLLLRKYCILLAVLVSANSFQNSHHVKSISCVTKYREKRRKNAPSRSTTNSGRVRVIDGNNSRSRDATSVLFSDGDNSAKSNNDYNDDAFGFVFLGGYILSRDAIFAGTFLILSALAAIATRNGKLPTTKSVPAAVAGCTLLVNLIIPDEKLYELLPFIERAEPSLPLDSSWIELGFCTASIVYGFIISSYSEEENT